MAPTAGGDSRTSGRGGSGWAAALALGVVVAATVVAVAAGLTARQQPTYTASAVIALTIPHTGVERAPAMGTQREVAVSLLVAEAAARRLGGDPVELREDLRVTVPVDTNVLHLEFDAPTPEDARDGAAAFARSYLDYRLQRGPTAASSAAIISAPVLPKEPSRPSWVVNLAAAGVLGLGLGAAATYAQLLRRRRSEDEDVAEPAVEVLAVVPRGGVPWLGSRARQDATAEHYRRVRAHLLSATGRAPGFSSVLVTSARGRDTTTTVALQLGAALAAAGFRTVVMSPGEQSAPIPLRGARPEGPGLWHVLVEDRSPSDLLVATPVHGLFVLPRGTSTGMSDRLAVAGLQRVFTRLSDLADFVLVDAPGVLDSSATLEAAADCSSAILVLDEQEDADDAAGAVAELVRRGVHVLGGVVTVAGRLPARLARLARPAARMPAAGPAVRTEPLPAAAPPAGRPPAPQHVPPPARPAPSEQAPAAGPALPPEDGPPDGARGPHAPDAPPAVPEPSAGAHLRPAAMAGREEC